MGQTPKWGLPYPEAATLITDSAAIVQELAEKIDTALSAVTASDAYTVPGTLIADMTTSGTFTPPAGVTVVHVVVIGGGGNGGGAGQFICGGGGGGQVVVGRGVPVSADVTVVIGGQQSPTSFGSLSALPGGTANQWAPGISPNPLGRGNGGTGGDFYVPASAGPTVNGTHYAGGGGGFDYRGNPNKPGSGGAGGGGASWNEGTRPGGNGSAGTGGGGGAGNSTYNPKGVGLGGSGRVMVYTEQPTMRRKAPTPNPDPLIVAALDDHGTMTGAYAVDVAAKDLPDTGVRVIDYPTAPVDTGRTITAPADPDDPDGPTVEVPVMAWPEAGWTYTDTDGWKEPHDQATA